ncbi:hypothetical protein CRG98_018533 [Punica granatum]|uniref:Lipoxygenase domain-containing protein n=1 Tax=Punica granatum TaxID=22663 RepID=A0A2I0JXM7_PUNGR|nr:hypothetical protein CRG98_018533 [Punica granatum]
MMLKPQVHSSPVKADDRKAARPGFAPGNIRAIVTAAENATTTSTVKAVVTVTPPTGGALYELGINRGLDLIALLFSTEATGLEKPTIKGYAHKTEQKENEVKYECEFKVRDDFGEVGAVLVENEHHKEMFLRDIVVNGLPDGPVTISCSSWVCSKFDDPKKRLYLPSDTPDGLRRLREEELKVLRGNGQGERKTYERIYDYDVYNDVGDPDSSSDKKRPVLGGKKFPYPRRCRTGRPLCKTDPESESKSLNIYVPRDEAFSEVKNLTFSAKTVYSVLHALVPSLERQFLLV